MQYVLAPFKYVFRKFWIWARRFLLLGGPLLVGRGDYLTVAHQMKERVTGPVLGLKCECFKHLGAGLSLGRHADQLQDHRWRRKLFG